MAGARIIMIGGTELMREHDLLRMVSTATLVRRNTHAAVWIGN
jgi:hypothetical protein